MGKGLIVYSSRTGNTERVARGISQGLGNRADSFSVEEAPSANGYDWILLGFWVEWGKADSMALGYLDSLEGLPVGFFGTMGASPNSDYAARIRDGMEEKIGRSNTFLGGFLCQGTVDPAVMRDPSFPLTSLLQERRSCGDRAAYHPDYRDIRRGLCTCRRIVGLQGLHV